jgi:uncharacterized protein (TIGR03000 family)
MMPPPPAAGGKAPAQGEKIKAPKETKEEEARGPAPATILVSLPAEAKLTIDGTVTQSSTATRVFASPALEPGNEYFYTLKAEIVRDGRTETSNQRVAVKAGNETRVSFDFPANPLAQR